MLPEGFPFHQFKFALDTTCVTHELKFCTSIVFNLRQLKIYSIIPQDQMHITTQCYANLHKLHSDLHIKQTLKIEFLSTKVLSLYFRKIR